jgi:hypothetical protein
MAKNIEFSAEEMSELHAFYTIEMEKAELRLKAIKSIIAKIGSAPLKRGPKPSVQKQLNNEVASEIVELNKTKVAGRKPGRPAKAKSISTEPKIAKRPGRPAKVKSEIVTLDLVVNADVLTVPKKRGPKPGSKYNKSAVKKTRVSKASKVKLADTGDTKLVSLKSSEANLTAPVSPKKRGPKPGSKYKKTAAPKTRVTKPSKANLVKTADKKSVSVEASSSNLITATAPKKRGPKPGAKYTKGSVETNSTIESKTNLPVVKNKKSVSGKSKRTNTPKSTKKVISVKSSETISDVVDSKPTSINNEIEALKLSVAKLNKPQAVKVKKVAKAVVVKPTKTNAVKVNNSAKKSPVVKVKAPTNVVAKVEAKEPQA